jgi:hypothetical protein
MPRRLVRLPASAAPLLDLASYARPGPGRRDRISSGELEHIARTVGRTPEVMVKVLSKGGQDLRAIRRHIDYLRFRNEGDLAVETDQGEQVGGEGGYKRPDSTTRLEGIAEGRTPPDGVPTRRCEVPSQVGGLIASRINTEGHYRL